MKSSILLSRIWNHNHLPKVSTSKNNAVQEMCKYAKKSEETIALSTVQRFMYFLTYAGKNT